MASALLEELKTVATEAKRTQIEDAVGSSWAALAAEEDPQGRGIGTLQVETGAGGGGGGEVRERGRGERGGRGGGGVGQREQWEDPLATQSDREIELSQTNRGVGGVCVGVVPRVQSKLSRAPHAHHGKKLLQDLQTQKSAATKRAMVRFRGSREKGAMAFVECLGFSQEDTMEGPLWRETLGRSLGSHDATELVGGMCHGNGWTCGDVGSDVHALIKELAIRRVQHRSETYSNESQHLAKGTEIARLRRRFSFVLQQALSFRTRHYLCRQGGALASTRRPHSQDPASVQAHRTGGVTGSEGQEGANGVGGGIGVGGGNGDGNEDLNGHRDGDGAGTGTGVEVNEGVQNGNGDGSGDGAGTGTGVGTRGRTPDGSGDGNGDGSEDCSGDGNGGDDNGNENRIGEGGREAKKRNKP